MHLIITVRDLIWIVLMVVCVLMFAFTGLYCKAVEWLLKKEEAKKDEAKQNQDAH